tara:strand:- start:1 stop:1950 length:1950 start_codon:yes stop_codon:yes gene_type:complete
MATPEQLQQASNKILEAKELQEEAEEDIEVGLKPLKDEGTIALSLQQDLAISSEHEIVAKLCNTYKMNATQAKKHLDYFPKQYELYGQGIPEVIKAMRNERRGLKGNNRDRMTKSIDDLIDGYSEHLEKCIDTIYWIAPYKSTLKKMSFNEKDLFKLHNIKKVDDRRNVIDALCKYWEAELDQKNMPYNKEYATLHKEMSNAKREFRKTLKDVKKTLREETNEFILKQVCENQGISARQIHDRMPSNLYNRTSWHSISKMIKPLDIVSLEGSYYKFNSDIKKNVYAYTAAFIDSDGYITMDRNHNPRVGLVATGDRGKAFMMEMKKALGDIGKLHLDQKSPQNTRPVNRLNFYSQAEVTELLTKCLPHFRMKKSNANILLELIRMKKSHKKADWYKGRCTELFKLMKYENHKDHVGYDFVKEGIDIETVAKLHDNCKMSTMDALENISSPILKVGNLGEGLKNTFETVLELKPRIEETREEDQTSIQIDMEDLEKNCCANAKTEIMEVWGNRIERYKSEGRTDKANTVEKEYDTLDKMPCDDLKAHITYIVDINEVAPKGKKLNPELVKLKKILKEWKECETGLSEEWQKKNAMLKSWQDQLKKLTPEQQKEVNDLVKFKNMSEEDAVRIIQRKYGLSSVSSAKGSWQP